jgi:uncharacterized protein (TIGR00369 family)
VTTSGFAGTGEGRGVSHYVGVALREADDGAIVGHAPAAAHLRGANGATRAGALLTMIDNVGGIGSGLAALPEGWVVSTNLAARTFCEAYAGPFRIGARVLRRGRNNVVTAVQIRDEGAHDALVADGVLTSAILVPENGPPDFPRPLRMQADTPLPEPARPLEEWLGIRPVGDATLEIELADELRNPWGILHGGVVSFLVDVTAEHATGAPTRDVVLHFIAPNRIGPVRARARVVGTRNVERVARVEIRDEGADRVTAVAVVTTRE